MSPADWFWLIAGCGLIGAIVIALNWRHPPRDQTAWDRSTARDIVADIAEARRRREIAQLEADYKAPPKPRNTISHQTRRTEEDQ